MAVVEVIFKLPEELIKEADEFGVLSDQIVIQLLRDEIDRRMMAFADEETQAQHADQEAAWETTILSKIPGINPNGSIDFEVLRQTGIRITPDEFFMNDL